MLIGCVNLKQPVKHSRLKATSFDLLCFLSRSEIPFILLQPTPPLNGHILDCTFLRQLTPSAAFLFTAVLCHARESNHWRERGIDA